MGKGQGCSKVTILQLAIWYLNVTMNRNTWKPEPEVGTDGSCQTRHNPRVHSYGSGFGPPRCCGSGFWTGLDPNWTGLAIRTQSAGVLPLPVGNITLQIVRRICAWYLCQIWYTYSRLWRNISMMYFCPWEPLRGGRKYQAVFPGISDRRVNRPDLMALTFIWKCWLQISKLNGLIQGLWSALGIIGYKSARIQEV